MSVKNPIEFYREPTWGDPDKLINALIDQSSTADTRSFLAETQMQKVFIQDLRQIRNALVHPSRGAIGRIAREVSPRYSLQQSTSSSFSVPMELVYSINISAQRIAVEKWVDAITQASKVA